MLQVPSVKFQKSIARGRLFFIYKLILMNHLSVPTILYWVFYFLYVDGQPKVYYDAVSLYLFHFYFHTNFICYFLVYFLLGFPLRYAMEFTKNESRVLEGQKHIGNFCGVENVRGYLLDLSSETLLFYHFYYKKNGDCLKFLNNLFYMVLYDIRNYIFCLL